jgi:hypothetical protein
MAPAAAAPAPPPAASGPGFLARIFIPDPAVNYAFISVAYALLALVSASLFAAQYSGAWPASAGYWIITAPCALSLPYVLFLWYRQRAAAAKAGAGAAAGGESKKAR